VFLLLVAGLLVCVLDENEAVFTGAPAAGDCLVSEFIISL
jgi:hypothetical protein